MVDYIKIAISFEDGSVGIMSLVTNDGYSKVYPSDTYIESLIVRNNFSKKVNSWRKISDNEVPSDRAYRDAWVDTGKKIDHDIAKARIIHLDKLREERDVEFSILDRDWLVLSAKKDQVGADSVEARRQELRDMPVAASAKLSKCKTIDAIKKVTL